jgi:hypothetical protein
MTLQRYQYTWKGPEFHGIYQVIENIGANHYSVLFETTCNKAAKAITTTLNRQSKHIQEVA